FVNIRASFFYNCKVFNQVHWLRLAMGLALFDHKLAKSAIPPCDLHHKEQSGHREENRHLKRCTLLNSSAYN
ncbi:hypothetical protein, partial [Pseudoalteromonas peptidolytica]|uniref:hypothetical protein n=1 Tax=Pseudoalteromonas peptidolytica TaxID=61150 RepID=UPI001B3B26ED